MIVIQCASLVKARHVHELLSGGDGSLDKWVTITKDVKQL